MTASLLLRVPLTVAFVAATAYCLARCVALGHGAGLGHGAVPGRRVRVGDCAQAGWSGQLGDVVHVAMCAVMVAMLWGWPWTDPWGVELTGFAAAATWFIARAAAAATRRTARVSLANQGVAMAAMCWMLRPAPTAMAMPGMAGGTSPVVSAAGVVLITYLGVAAAWWVLRARAAATARTAVLVGPVGDATCQAVMAAGMCVVLALAAS